MTTATSSPRRKRSWVRKLLFVFAGLLVLLVVAYFVVTSSAFFKGVILPRASNAIGGRITVAEASISPFSQVHLRQLKIQTTGTEPLVQAEEVRLRYSLISILRGTIKVDEVTLVSPVIQVIENADGSSNLDPLSEKEAKPASKPSAPSGKPPQIDLKNFTLKNTTIRLVKNLKTGGREITELSGVNITLDQLKNGRPGKATLAAALKMMRSTNDVLEAKCAGQIEFTLGADLIPQVLKAKVEQEVLRAEGSLRELAGQRTTFTADVTPTEFKEFSLRFNQGDKLLGEVKASGPLDLSKKEGHLKVEVASIDRQVLNLIGAPQGIDFGATTLNSTSEISLTQGGSVIAANTRFNVVKFSLAQNGRTSPPLDLQVACDFTMKTTDKTAVLQTLTLDGTQNQKPILHGSLTQPMTLAWGDAPGATGDSAFELTVTDINFADWKAMLGDSISAGTLSLKLNVLSQQGGKQLKLDITSQIADLAMRLGANSLTQAALTLSLNGQVNDLKKFNFTDYRLDRTQRAQPALKVSGSASYDGAAFNLQTQIEAVMARLLGRGSATPLTVGVKLDGTFTNQVLDLRQLQLALTPTERAPKNEMNVTGQLDLSSATTKGHLNIKADTFDVTQLYDAFAAGKNSSPTNAPAQPTAESSPRNVEPDPVNPSLQFTGEANFGQLYLHEIAIANWQTTVKVDGGKITLDPCRLALNGAPVNATVDLNLGVKGYTYAITLVMDKAPLEPISNTFSPENRGKYQGLILANAQIKGAGITGASLQKSLSGQVSLSFTNANIALMGPKMRKVVAPIATLLHVSEITQSPLSWMDSRIQLGDGNINLQRFVAQSEAFEARTQGTIPIAEVLTNSPLNLPVDFALRRSLADKVGLLPANTPTNAMYAMLPKFVTIKGTIGEPKSDLNELALGGMLLKSGIGITEKLGGNVDGTAGEALKGVGNLLTGQKSASTNSPATNSAPAFNPLDLFKKK